jgi:4a-hydroxytetrahydrobiopterin dehydratase
MALLDAQEVERALGDLAGWRREGDAITRELRAGSFLDGIRLVQQVAEVAEERDHHPDIDIRYTTLRFTLSTHSEGGITGKDLELARQIDGLAADAGV